jgi:uncharacterized protein (TIGR02246 family)
MPSDEQQIRDLVAAWMAATRAGDTATVLSLMTDDAVFLRPGHPPMRKAEFAKQAQAQTGEDAPRIEGQGEIQELQVHGDIAYAWTQLVVTMTPKDGQAMRREGPTLTVYRKENGRWLLARDANMLAAPG